MNKILTYRSTELLQFLKMSISLFKFAKFNDGLSVVGNLSSKILSCNSVVKSLDAIKYMYKHMDRIDWGWVEFYIAKKHRSNITTGLQNICL